MWGNTPSHHPTTCFRWNIVFRVWKSLRSASTPTCCPAAKEYYLMCCAASFQARRTKLWQCFGAKGSTARYWSQDCLFALAHNQVAFAWAESLSLWSNETRLQQMVQQTEVMEVTALEMDRAWFFFQNILSWGLYTPSIHPKGKMIAITFANRRRLSLRLLHVGTEKLLDKVRYLWPWCPKIGIVGPLLLNKDPVWNWSCWKSSLRNHGCYWKGWRVFRVTGGRCFFVMAVFFLRKTRNWKMWFGVFKS